MAMDPATEAGLIIDNLSAIFPRMADPAFRPELLQYWTAVCAGEITHKIAAMDVLPATHGAKELTSPAGQAVTITTGIAIGDDGRTDFDVPITGTGSVQ